MRSYWSKADSESIMTSVLIKREKLHPDTCTQSQCLVEVGLRLPQAKEQPEIRRGRNRSSLEPSEEAWPYDTLISGS